MLIAMPGPTSDRLGARRSITVTLIPFVVLLGLGFVFARVIRTQAVRREVADAARATELVARLGVQPNLTRHDITGGFTPDRLAAFRRKVERDFVGHGVIRVKIWNRNGVVVYSDEPGVIGRSFPASDELADALKGESRSELSRLDKIENRTERGQGRAIEVYVPLRFPPNGAPDGAFEMYLSYAPVEAAVARDTRQMYSLLLAALTLLYFALIRISHDSRRLRTRANSNEFLALHDPLTQLANRALFRDRVEHAIAAMGRGGRGVAVLFIDLDNFKRVNDSAGHAVGDQLLMAVADRLTRATRAPDTAARLGGDEFAVLVEHVGCAADVGQVAARILQALQSPIHLDDRAIVIDASVGVALTFGDCDVDDLLRNADVAMYWAKSAGKGRFEFFEQSMYTAVMARLHLEGEIHRGIDEGQFVLHYQPIVDLERGTVGGVEALVRWSHPERGLLLPEDFLPVAEETGLVAPLGKWVLAQACADLARWQRRLSMPDLYVSVNLSTRQLSHPQLVDDVAGALRTSGLAASSLVLEITETALLTDVAGASINLEALRRIGTRLALDDFGTGYSSLSHLQAFAVDLIKIDRCFVNGAERDERKNTLLRALITMTRALGLAVVAEGVERSQDAALLRTLGCAFGQGYLFSKAVDKPPSWRCSRATSTSAASVVGKATRRLAALDRGQEPVIGVAVDRRLAVLAALRVAVRDGATARRASERIQTFGRFRVDVAQKHERRYVVDGVAMGLRRHTPFNFDEGHALGRIRGCGRLCAGALQAHCAHCGVERADPTGRRLAVLGPVAVEALARARGPGVEPLPEQH